MVALQNPAYRPALSFLSLPLLKAAMGKRSYFVIVMKQIKGLKWLAVTLVAAFTLCLTARAEGPSKKDAKRLAYVVKGLKLNKTEQTRLAPVFYAYLKQLHAAKDVYNAPKRQLKAKIDAGRLSQSEARNLLNAHWQADEKEVAVKKKYTPLFIEQLGPQRTYQLFRLANDKEATK